MVNEYEIRINTKRMPEGFFWMVVEKNTNSNQGFGYESTLDKAFEAAKTELDNLS